MTDLSVSSNTADAKCLKAIAVLRTVGVPARVTPSLSVMDDGNVEPGCVIRLPRTYGNDDKEQLRKLWSHLNSDYRCAHLSIQGKYDGCILDYLRPSCCPM